MPWQFRLAEGRGATAGWTTIQVPSRWEQQGFGAYPGICSAKVRCIGETDRLWVSDSRPMTDAMIGIPASFRIDLVGEESRDIAVDSIALRRGRAPFGAGDMVAGLGELGYRRSVERTIAEIIGGDQRAMHQQIGIAPDRRGEMRIAAERQAEVAEILRRVDRLRTASAAPGVLIMSA